MDSKSVLNAIRCAIEGSTIVINFSNTIIKVKENNLSIVEMEDNSTIYMYDEHSKKSYYVYAPSVDAIRILE